jgi:hypothetical protein
MRWNSTRFTYHMRFHEELTTIVTKRAEEIVLYLGKHGWMEDYDEYAVTIKYRDSCHCHPEYRTFTFPSHWLFAENWKEEARKVLDREQEKQKAIEQKNIAIKEQQQLKEYERLKAQFEPPK